MTNIMTIEEIKQTYEDKLVSLREILEQSENSDYILNGLCKLYESLLENDQFYGEVVSEPKIVKRMIKSNRYIPNYVLDYWEANRLVLGGLYIMVDLYVFPTSMIRANMKKNRHSGIVHPEEDGLLPDSEVNYGTTKIINDTYSVAIKRGSFIDDYIRYASQYEYVTLNT